MVVCIDTSGSMEGEPGRIAQSMVMRLVELADSFYSVRSSSSLSQ